MGTASENGATWDRVSVKAGSNCPEWDDALHVRSATELVSSMGHSSQLILLTNVCCRSVLRRAERSAKQKIFMRTYSCTMQIVSLTASRVALTLLHLVAVVACSMRSLQCVEAVFDCMFVGHSGT